MLGLLILPQGVKIQSKLTELGFFVWYGPSQKGTRLRPESYFTQVTEQCSNSKGEEHIHY